MKRVFLLVILLLVSSPTLAQNQLPNGTFDTDVNGWMAFPGGFAGAVEWSPVQGQPPGALRLIGEDDATRPDICFPTISGTYQFRADVYMDTSGEFILCSINYALYSSPDCSDAPAFFVDDGSGTAFPFVTAPHEWQTLDFPIGGDLPADNINSIRPVMGKGGDIGGDDACVMDNVYFEITPAPTTIPTVSSVGLGLLAVLLVAAGLVVLRRLHS